MSEPLPEPLQRDLESKFARLVERDLNPEWHDDARGFDFDCPACKERGEEHRSGFRYEAMPIAALGLLGLGPLPMTPNDSATGPAS